ncbi:MAG: hypothetical protein K9I99_11540 [Melioribacteraceae bacterium]|nr:hypothetical protein [Melioribacteraceae bacterium]
MKPTILIIDENTFELLRLRKILSKEGYNIMTATNHETAKNICDKMNVDYVVGTKRFWECNPKSFPGKNLGNENI